jgi:hypothetical protein
VSAEVGEALNAAVAKAVEEYIRDNLTVEIEASHQYDSDRDYVNIKVRLCLDGNVVSESYDYASF